jgi:hypothetical protein
MSSALLESLRGYLEEELDGVTSTPEGLRAVADVRYGEVVVRVDHDQESHAVRVQVSVPPPAGAGHAFLIWCMSINTRYWDVKLGLDPDGMLSVHADLEVEGTEADEMLATDVADRVDSILQLLDEDLTDHLLAAQLGTPAQRARWESRPPTGAESED